MEAPYSHSRPPTFSSSKKSTKPPFFSSSSSSSSSTFNNNGGNFFTTSYDDVFGGPPKFTSSSSLAPRPEDYSEIFGGFRSSSSASSSSLRSSSSIPVLDLPAVPDDIHSASVAFFDYSEVFGGFNAVDFAVPFDQLFRPCHGEFCDVDDDHLNDHGSSDEAWTPVGTGSLSDDSDPFASSEKSQCFSNENSHQPLESKQFNVSYHKVNPGTSFSTPNTMHVAQLNDMPGYTCVVDESTSLREMGKDTFSPVGDDIVIDMAIPSDLPEKQARKTMSHASYDNNGLKSDSDHRSGKIHNATISHVKSPFASASNVNPRAEPSHLPARSQPPPVVEDRNGDIGKRSSGPVASEKCGLATVDGNLPSFFDMEVDASSSAAASAAAMKDVMDKAQAKLKAAKESRDRKDRVQNRGKLHLETDVDGGENILEVHDECVSRDTRVQATTDGGTSKVKNSAKSSHAKIASQNLPDILAGEQPSGVSVDISVQAIADGSLSKVKNSAKARQAKSVSQNIPDTLYGEQPSGVPGKLIDTKQGNKSSLSMDTAFTDAAGQWKEARQYYEFVNNDNTKIATQPPSSNSDAKAATKPQVVDGENSDSSGDAYVPRENRRRLKATKSVSRQGYYEKMVKVAQEVHDSVINGHVEPDKRSKGMSQGNPKLQKSEFVHESERSDILLCKAQKVGEKPEDVTLKGEAVMRSKYMLEKEDSKKQSEVHHSDKIDISTQGPHESMVQEASAVMEAVMSESHQREKGDDTVRETVEREGRDQRANESWGRQRAESRASEAPKQKINKTREVEDKRLEQPFEDVLDIQTAFEIEEKGNAKDLQQMKAADEKLNEDKIVSGTETLQRSCESPENRVQNLQQRDEYENNLEADVDGQKSKKKLENFVVLENCQENEEAPEQMRRKQRHYEVSNNIWAKQNLNEGHEQDEKTTEHVEHDSLQAYELDETMKSNVHTKQKLKDAKKSHINTEWENEDPLFDSSPDVELPTQDKHHKFSNGANLCEEDVELNMSCKLKKPQKTTNGFEEVTSEKQNGDISTRTFYDNNEFEAVETTDVRIDESQIDPTAAEVGSNDIDELKGRVVQASDKVDLNENHTKRGSVCTSSEQTLKEEQKVDQLDSTPNIVKDINVEGGEKRSMMGDGLLRVNHRDKVRPTPGEGYNDHTSKEDVAHSILPEDKEISQKKSEQLNLGQSIERKGKIIDHSSSKKKDEDKERGLEKERLQKLEEERDRLREREKDRMAVELAVREARDRAYADARDRAERIALERATDEARQRAMAEARERLEKACAEARERSLSDKGSEARLKAERAAVERANAEARQRAIEKTMADRATFEARERMQRSVSEKYISERDVILRQSSFPTSSERYETSYGEPAQRCKARLERHRRTVERVANALAEKNMRDSLAQREQAERTRLAETLDGDIRRWSSGKEGNLRALLSTLQYILGPDSGWQPIPLTEVITAAAVKKAYRKATLCVHPDKLQQRGASIQQKYICEKVFDLLKEAWNRFNSEEK